MAVTGPKTGFLAKDSNTGNDQDLGERYVSKDYLLDVYPNIVPGKTVPGLWTWGGNGFGALGLNNTTNQSSPVQVGTLTNWRSVPAGNGYSAAVKSDGTLWSWGYNAAGPLGLGNTTSRSSPVQVGTLATWRLVSTGSRGDPHTAAIRTNGTLWIWGYNAYGQLGLGDASNRSSPVQIGTLTNWKSVGCGFDHTAAIKTDGTLWSWGYNGSGQ